MYRMAVAAAALVCFLGVGAAVAQQQPPKRLHPRLPQHLLQVRFSLDGHYLLAQGRSGVAVLTVQPFRVVLRAPAQDASLADFTPDSQHVVFVSSVASLQLTSGGGAAHMERWSIADQARVDFTAMQPQGCSSNGLSPDGRFLVCVNARGTLRIIEVATGETIFEKQKFGVKWVIYTDQSQGNPAFNAQVGDPGSARIDFSPDGHFLIASPKAADGATVAFDLAERTVLKLQGQLKELTTSVDYTFLGADRVLMGGPTAVLAFPSAEVLLRPHIMPGGRMSRAADPRFVLMFPWGPWGHYKKVFADPSGYPGTRSFEEYTPLEDPGMGALELDTGKAIVTKTPPLDVFGNYYAAELTDGRLGLYDRGKGLQAAVTLDELQRTDP